ncbi:MAG: DUF92 domain-containing protein [Firmicutes bacterium]|nr:DUF92 domain-containing protein [Bacillota bacterium]
MIAAPGAAWGFLAAAFVAATARRAGMLTAGGAVAATAVGGAVFGFGGWAMAAPLLFFFVSGSLLARVGRAVKDRRLDHADSRGRRALQVLANGAAAALAAVAYRLSPGPGWLAALGGALAAAAADTWATEAGVLARRAVLVTTWTPVPPGRSGAVSVLGTIAGVTGSVLTAAVFAGAAALFGPAAAASPGMLVAAAGGGVIGMAFDSILGATVQERFWCPACRTGTEKRVHRCGAPPRRGAGRRAG